MSEAETKPCPMCGETILAVAKKCKHCRSTLDEQPAPPPAPVASIQSSAPAQAGTALHPAAQAVAKAQPRAANSAAGIGCLGVILCFVALPVAFNIPMAGWALGIALAALAAVIGLGPKALERALPSTASAIIRRQLLWVLLPISFFSICTGETRRREVAQEEATQAATEARAKQAREENEAKVRKRDAEEAAHPELRVARLQKEADEAAARQKAEQESQKREADARIARQAREAEERAAAQARDKQARQAAKAAAQAEPKASHAAPAQAVLAAPASGVSSHTGAVNESWLESCHELEQRAYDGLKNTWQQIPAAVRKNCDAHTRKVEAAYIQLSQCVESAANNKTFQFKR